jgi:hypothetical protein
MNCKKMIKTSKGFRGWGGGGEKKEKKKRKGKKENNSKIPSALHVSKL